MVVRKCIVESLRSPGMYQIDYVPFEPIVKKRGRPSQYDLERKEDPRMPVISISYMYGNEQYVVVERAFIFEGRIYSKFKKFKHVNARDSNITGDTHYLEANIHHLLKKVKLPAEIRTEVEKAFRGNGQKLEDKVFAPSSVRTPVESFKNH